MTLSHDSVSPMKKMSKTICTKMTTTMVMTKEKRITASIVVAKTKGETRWEGMIRLSSLVLKY